MTEKEERYGVLHESPAFREMHRRISVFVLSAAEQDEADKNFSERCEAHDCALRIFLFESYFRQIEMSPRPWDSGVFGFLIFVVSSRCLWPCLQAGSRKKQIGFCVLSLTRTGRFAGIPDF